MERAALDSKDQNDGSPEQAEAQSCTACGHIRGRMESESRCARCGEEPARWQTAPVNSGPVDAAEPATGEAIRDEPSQERGTDPTELFSTAPAGVAGLDVNPELRVRY